MNRQIKLHAFADVDRSGKVRWVAHELGYEILEQRVPPGEQSKPPYADINPYGQIPAMELDGEIIIESTAACVILAERHPESGLIPDQERSDGAPRRAFWQAVSVATHTLENPVTYCYLSQLGFVDERWQAICEADMLRRLRIFAGRIPAAGYLIDGGFSLADVFAGYVLRIAVQGGYLQAEGPVGDYLQRLRDRPAAQAAKFFASLEG